MTISGPRPNEHPEDRLLSCEEAIEAEFQELVFRAVRAGWDEAEVCVAIASLADHHVLAMQANDGIEASIRKLKE
jgi:hypothetical protein